MMLRLADRSFFFVGWLILSALLTLPGFVRSQVPNLARLDLDKTRLYLPCNPKINVARYTCPVGTIVKVSAVTGKTRARIRYSVTGGKIVGTGSSVTWDIGGVRPGTYRITAKSEDSSLTREVTLQQCPDCGSECLSCPELHMEGPKPELPEGRIYTVSANVVGGSQDTITYKWTISTGEIIDGQGTRKLRFKIPRDTSEKKITVTYDIGVLDPSCFACPAIFSQALALQDNGHDPKPMADSLELDKTEVLQRPPPGFRSASGDCERSSIIEVRTIRSGIATKNVEYDYSVPAGKIVGLGPNVKWDLTDVKPEPMS